MKKKIINKSEAGRINNLYRLSEYQPETFDFVELKNCLTSSNNRFLPIILKECATLVKTRGKLTVFYNPKQDKINPKSLEETIAWLFNTKFKILSHEQAGGLWTLSLERTSSDLIKGDDVDKWTFGMVTNGVRMDFIDKSIESIRNLKIPHYEIIICGTYPKKIEKDMRYIHFTERDDKGWITKKKNLIAQAASYENLCIFHDRIVFNKDWYKGMKKFGNSFDVISCVQKLSTGVRVGDWLTTNVDITDVGYMYRIEELDYRDWDKNAYVSGQLTIIKKTVWKKVPWNEKIYWQQAEDIEYSSRLTAEGFLPRFNPFSSCLTLSWRFGTLPKKPYDSKSISYYFKDVPLRRATRRAMYYVIKLPKAKSAIKYIYPKIANSSIYKIIREN